MLATKRVRELRIEIAELRPPKNRPRRKGKDVEQAEIGEGDEGQEAEGPGDPAFSQIRQIGPR